MRFHSLLLDQIKRLSTGQTAVLRGQLPNRTTLDETWLDDLALHNSALYHTDFRFFNYSSWLCRCLCVQSASDFGLDGSLHVRVGLGFCLFARLNLFLFTEVMHVVRRAALAATHWRWWLLLFDLVLETLLLFFDWQAFLVEFCASEIVAQRLRTFAPA